MGCEETRDLLPLYAGGDLPREIAARLEVHTVSCAACARELDLYRDARTQVASLRVEEQQVRDWSAMSAAVQAELFPRTPRPSFRIFDEALRYAAVLMVGLAIGVGAYALQRPSGPSSPAAVAGTGEPRGLQGMRPVHAGGARPLQPPAPPRAPEAGFYLPKVESLLDGGSKDF